MYVRFVKSTKDKANVLKLLGQLLVENGISPTLRKPELNHSAFYFGLIDKNNENQYIGFSEVMIFDEKFSIDQFREVFDLTTLGIPGKLAHFKSLYIEKSHRRKGYNFANLAFYSVYYLRKRGVTHFTIMVQSSAVKNIKFYLRLGGEVLAKKHIKGGQHEVVLILLDITNFDKHSFTKSRNLFKVSNEE